MSNEKNMENLIKENKKNKKENINNQKELQLNLNQLVINNNPINSRNYQENKDSSPKLGEINIEFKFNQETAESQNSLSKKNNKKSTTPIFQIKEDKKIQSDFLLDQEKIEINANESITGDNNNNLIINDSLNNDNNNKVDLINTNNVQIKKARRDFFGRVIKKKGKHKISFADEVYILKQMGQKKRYADDYEPAHETIDMTNYGIRGRKGKSSKTLRINEIEILNKMKKENMNKKGEGSTPLVEVIEVESFKEETKQNSFLPVNLDTTLVCCSSICLII